MVNLVKEEDGGMKERGVDLYGREEERKEGMLLYCEGGNGGEFVGGVRGMKEKSGVGLVIGECRVKCGGGKGEDKKWGWGR